MKIKLIRHATLILSINGIKILVDPMLGSKGIYNPIPSHVIKHNPTIELPVTKDELERLLKGIDIVLLTHIHNDHFDKTAQEILSKEIPVICQPEDEEKLKELGFKDVYPVGEKFSFKGINFIRTGAQHGTGETAIKMAPVSGFCIEAHQEPSLYIAGDTIWCKEVEDALEKYNPSSIVLNAGAARFLTGDPITMDSKDIFKVCEKSRDARIIAVHMEALNHCGLTRDHLRQDLQNNNLIHRVLIPEDGEELTI